MKIIQKRERSLFKLLAELVYDLFSILRLLIDLIYILFSIVEVLITYLVDGLLLVVESAISGPSKQKKAHRYR